MGGMSWKGVEKERLRMLDLLESERRKPLSYSIELQMHTQVEIFFAYRFKFSITSRFLIPLCFVALETPVQYVSPLR